MHILIYVVILGILFALPPVRIAMYAIGRFLVEHPVITFIGLSAVLSVIGLCGYLFLDIYTMTGIAIIVILSILAGWSNTAAHLRNVILVLGLLIWVGARIAPIIESHLQVNFPAYKEWRNDEKRLVNNKMAERSISVKKELMTSEVTKGTFGRLISNSVAYDENGAIIVGLEFQKGQRIMSLGLQSKKQTEDPNGSSTEGMAYVSLPNDHGDFVKSRTVLIPIQKIEWESVQKEIQKKDEERAKKIESFTPHQYRSAIVGCPDARHSYIIHSSIHEPDRLELNLNYGMRFIATSVDGVEYHGTWQQNGFHGDIKISLEEGGKGGTGILEGKDYNCSISLY